MNHEYGDSGREFSCSSLFTATFECEDCHKSVSVKAEEPGSIHHYMDGTASSYFRFPLPKEWSKLYLKKCAVCAAAYSERMEPVWRAQRHAAETAAVASLVELLKARDYDTLLGSNGGYQFNRLVTALKEFDKEATC